MPIYAMRCDCGNKEDIFRHNSDSHIHACICGKIMKKDWQAMRPAYHDVPVDSIDTDLTGKPIVYHTRGQLKALAKQHGCSVDFGASHKSYGRGIR